MGASAAISEPTASVASATTSIRSLPTLSPTRPMIGVKTDAESRYAVSTQVTVAWSVSSAASMVGSTGLTIDCSRENEETPTQRTRKVTR